MDKQKERNPSEGFAASAHHPGTPCKHFHVVVDTYVSQIKATCLVVKLRLKGFHAHVGSKVSGGVIFYKAIAQSCCHMENTKEAVTKLRALRYTPVVEYECLD